MKAVKPFFSSVRNAVLSILCAVVVLAAVGTGIVLAVQAVEKDTPMDRKAALGYALTDAGVSESGITVTKQKLDRADNCYEIEFYTDMYKYEYKIDLSTGAVAGVDIEAISAGIASGASAPEGASPSGGGESQEGTEGTSATGQEEPEGTPATGQEEPEGTPATGQEEPEGTSATGQGGAEGTQTAGQEGEAVDLEAAKAAALADAGFSAADVTFTKTKEDMDDGMPVYDIEFYTASAQYDYEISAITGAVLDKSMEALQAGGSGQASASGSAGTGTAGSGSAGTGTAGSGSAGTGTAGSGSTGSNPGQTSDINLNRAKEIAVADAGLALSDVTFTKAEQDWDDGVSVYELEFYTTAAEYEYEIFASNGGIKDSEVEWFQPASASGDGSRSYIGVDQAKEIALNHAGCDLTEVIFTKAKVEQDDGYSQYEIQFCHGSSEYEYCIEAYTGGILEWECGSCDNSSHNHRGHSSGHHR